MKHNTKVALKGLLLTLFKATNAAIPENYGIKLDIDDDILRLSNLHKALK